MKNVIIVDLDGTLADGTHRLHLMPPMELRDKTHCWDEFNLAAGGDAPIQDTIDIVNALYDSYTIVILTGRCDVAQDITIDWLEEHEVYYDDLIMRESGDHRTDVTIKEEVLRSIGLENIVACYDDLPHVVDHIRELGLTCYHVAAVNNFYADRNKDAGDK